MIVLDDTPPALSVGRLVSLGYAFVWINGAPDFRDPSGSPIFVFVSNDVPYIYNDSINPAVCAGEETSIDSEPLTERDNPQPP